MSNAPWKPGETPEERDAREKAYQRLASSARRAGFSLEKLHRLLGEVARNEAETRRFLAEDVYNVSDELLDDLLRVRLKDLDRE